VKINKKGSVLLIAGTLFLAACSSGGSSTPTSAAPEPTATGATSEAPAPAPAEPIRVALLTPGTSNDGSWGQAVSEGTRAAVEAIGGELTISEDLNEAADYEQVGNAYGTEGYDLVINANASMIDVTNRLSAKYPDTKWGQIGLMDAPTTNEQARLPVLWEGTFVAGYIAGKTTKTNTIGTIGGFEFPALTSEMEGWILGARYANPDVKVLRNYINTWTDSSIAGAAAEAMKADGADIIFSATDQATQGIFAVMGATPDHYVMAQYLDKTSQAPKVVLLSVLYGLGEICASFVEQASTGTWTADSKTLTFGDGLSLALNPELESVMGAETLAEAKALEEEIAAGTLKVPGLDILGVTGSGDEVDPTTLG
jgi:basic membrane protein A